MKTFLKPERKNAERAMKKQGKNEPKTQFVELRARGLSYAEMAKRLKAADGN
jgi:hypothetical protein